VRARAEIGEDARHAQREADRLQRKAVGRRHRALFVEEPHAIQCEQGLAEAGDGAEGAAHQVGDVGAVEALARIGQSELGFPLEALAQRLGK